MCGACSAKASGMAAATCARHGEQYIEFKCRFCCSIATFFCFGHTHFCEKCHQKVNPLSLWSCLLFLLLPYVEDKLLYGSTINSNVLRNAWCSGCKGPAATLRNWCRSAPAGTSTPPMAHSKPARSLSPSCCASACINMVCFCSPIY